MEGTPYVARLSELLEDLHTITSFRLSLHDLDGTEWYAAKKRTAFCDLICDTEEGYRRCLTCDRRAITAFGQLGRPIQYRCHAGLVDTAVPVVEHGAIVAVILFGQIVDDSPMDKQWAIVQKKCAWYHDMPALERAFYQVPRVSARQIKAFVAVLGACVGNLSLVHGDMNAQTDQQRLRSYVSIHYSSPLTLDGVAKALGMSRSKLWQVAASHPARHDADEAGDPAPGGHGPPPAHPLRRPGSGTWPAGWAWPTTTILPRYLSGRRGYPQPIPQAGPYRPSCPGGGTFPRFPPNRTRIRFRKCLGAAHFALQANKKSV